LLLRALTMVRSALMSGLAVAAGAGRAFPKIPAFSAELTELPFFSYQQNATNTHPHFDGGSLRMDMETESSAWDFTFSTYKWVGPAYGSLFMKQVCIGQECTTQDRNGTVAYRGVSPYVETLFSLWARLITGSEGNHTGPERISGEPCECWSLVDQSAHDLQWIKVCLGSDDVPRRIEVEPSGNAVGWSNVFEWAHNLSFHNISLAPVGDFEQLPCWTDNISDFRSCSVPSYGTTLQAIRAFNDPEPMGVLEDRDFCDWRGLGVTFGPPWSVKFSAAKYLEVFDVEITNDFGFWRDCNYNSVAKKNICGASVLNTSTLVTRSSAEMLQGKTLMGLCEENSEVGSWLTFPHEGKCDNMDELNKGTNGCTWLNKGAKVVLMDCMMSFNNSGWERAWKKDNGKGPFPNVMAHAKAAVKACPDVRDPTLVV